MENTSAPMARIRDTSGTFQAYARKAFLESPIVREAWWVERYEAELPDVFEAFYSRVGHASSSAALVRELTQVRKRVDLARPAVIEAIETVEPTVRSLMGMEPEPRPLHVLMVGPYATNAVVGSLGDDVVLFHCLEWFQPAQATAALVAHEDAHAWHRILHGEAAMAEDAAWLAFSEGLANLVSRRAAPGQEEADYFWYGHAGFEAWLPWCQEHAESLVERFAAEIDEPGAGDTWFGAGLVDGQWRVGYFVADRLVAGLGLTIPEMVALTPDDARRTIRDALGVS